MNQRTYDSQAVATNIDEICKLADELQSGCFIFVRGYHASNGEVANYWLNYGRDYVRIKENFIEKLKAILWKGDLLVLNLHYTTWVDEKGEHAREAAGRTKTRVELRGLDSNDPDVRQVLREMLRSYAVRQMRHARSGTIRKFDRQAKGIYIHNLTNTIYFRMSTLVCKEVIQLATVESYSTRRAAIKQMIKDKFLKMRAFKLGKFESMSIGGRQLLWKEVSELVPHLERVE